MELRKRKHRKTNFEFSVKKTGWHFWIGAKEKKSR
jgi:hypothetical protein